MSNFITEKFINSTPQDVKNNFSNLLNGFVKSYNSATNYISSYTTQYASANIGYEVVQFGLNVAFNSALERFIVNINSNSVTHANKVNVTPQHKVETELTYKGKFVIAAASCAVNKFFDAGYDHSISSLMWSFGGKWSKVAAIAVESYSAKKSSEDFQQTNPNYLDKDVYSDAYNNAYAKSADYAEQACNYVGADKCEKAMNVANDAYDYAMNIAGFEFPATN